MKDSLNYIKFLDLQYIVNRVVKQFNWKTDHAEETVRKYKNFLTLHLLYPEFKVVPTRAIDVVWHEHILHTQKYTEDCRKIFGDYFHHHPTEDKKTESELHDSNYIMTARLYEKQFQEPYGQLFDITIWF